MYTAVFYRRLDQGMLFRLLRGVQSQTGTVEWYRSSYGTDLNDFEIASTV